MILFWFGVTFKGKIKLQRALPINGKQVFIALCAIIVTSERNLLVAFSRSFFAAR
jgi:hypothetical protein